MTKRQRQDDFEGRVETHRHLLEKICRLYALRTEDRQDLAGEIVLQLWRAFPRFDATLRFSTWMCRIALNVAISHTRKEALRSRHAAPADARILDVEAKRPREEAYALYRMVEALEPLHRALTPLHLEGYSHDEIAEVLGLSATNVATKI